MWRWSGQRFANLLFTGDNSNRNDSIMEQATIDKYERRRWIARLVFAIIILSLGLFWAPVVFVPDFYGFSEALFLVVSLIVIALVLVTASYYDKYNKRIRREDRLNRALNSEMYRINNFRAFKATAIGMVCTAVILYIIGDYAEITLKAYSFMLILVWGLVYQAAWLIDNR